MEAQVPKTGQSPRPSPGAQGTGDGTSSSPRRRNVPSDTQVDEAALIHAAQAQDRAAFARLVEVYWPRLYRWLYHLSHDRHLAEDLAQETFLKAMVNLGSFRAGTNFKAWVFRIAHNCFLNIQRSPAQRRTPLPDDLPTRDQDPADSACSRETLADLAQAVERLPTEFRAALLLRAEEGLSFRQIAGVLETTEETARWRVFKARQKLLSQLGEKP